MGFPGYWDQSVLSFLKGRSSRFLQFFAVCSIMSRQEIFLVIVLVLTIMVFFLFRAGIKGALDFLVSEFSLEYCLSSGEVFLFVYI